MQAREEAERRNREAIEQVLIAMQTQENQSEANRAAGWRYAEMQHRGAEAARANADEIDELTERQILMNGSLL